jgi:hypothetical protein
MAIDVYLQLDGINGESSDKTHNGWIECESVVWEISQPRSATSSTGRGHTTERCFHKGIVIRKLSDLATPILLQTCAMGRTIPKAKIELLRADGNGARIKYFEGEKVLGNKKLAEGTAIATFVKGRWPGLAQGNHSAVYLGQVSNGIYVIDQWPAASKKFISKRFIYVKKINPDGTYVEPSDNAAAFSVIK